MADIAAGDVTYTIIGQNILESQQRMNTIKIQYGDGALTYPAGGIPLTKAKMGLPVNVDSAILYDAGSGDGYVHKYDAANNKIRSYEQDAGGALAELSGAVVATTLYMEVKGW